jgi:hypothetical protein
MCNVKQLFRWQKLAQYGHLSGDKRNTKSFRDRFRCSEDKVGEMHELVSKHLLRYNLLQKMRRKVTPGLPDGLF